MELFSPQKPPLGLAVIGTSSARNATASGIPH